MKQKIMITLLAMLVAALLLISGCNNNNGNNNNNNNNNNGNGVEEPKDRLSSIPSYIVRITPATDAHPPVMISDEYEDPVPVPGGVNTAGAEDSAYVMPDGNTLYYWFTPDGNIPPNEQLFDGVTHIYVSKKVGGTWSDGEPIVLNDKEALDGCGFVMDDTIYFCTARAGYTGMVWFMADLVGSKASNWRPVNFNPDYKVGELHITADGKELYYHSDRKGGKGNYDIWMLTNVNGEWVNPVNIEAVNTEGMDGWPFVTEDGGELWITRTHKGTPGLFRSKKVNGKWQEPELMVEMFAGEASLDVNGNLYFTHHFYKDSQKLEADIYVAKKK